MKKMIKKIQNTIFLLWKGILYFGLIGIFMGLFAIPNPQLIRPSRTMAVTCLTFMAVGLGMTAAYGKFDIGHRKSKPIIYSLGLAIGLTDVVTYLQLSIMNTNPDNNATLKFENLGLFAIVLLLQVFYIIVMTYAGNYIFFQINEPATCCIITASQNSLNQIYRAVSKYKKQFSVTRIIDYEDDNIYAIDGCTHFSKCIKQYALKCIILLVNYASVKLHR